ncbi:hypothetical protein VaNZ11_010620, partial [Volvox africanus]
MWIYQAVTNVGVQVLVLMGLGYIFARFKFLEQAKFLPQCNFLVLMLALPAFNLYLMGIKLDLQNPEPWKSLAAFLLWVFAVQTTIVFYTWRFCAGDAGEAAVLNMVLLMDNYAITGLLALNATLGTKWGTLALLMAMGFFLVIFPFSLAAFEWEKWAVQQHVEAIAEAAAQDIEAAAAAAAAAEEAAEADRGGKSPVSSSSVDEPPGPRGFGDGGGEGGAGLGNKPPDRGALELSLYPASASLPSLPPPLPPLPPVGMTKNAAKDMTTANGFPPDSRYCWWSNEAYRPARPLLGADVAHSSQHPFQRGSTAAAAAREEQQQPQRQQQRRRSQEPLLERLLQQAQQQQKQQQEAQRRATPYVPPLPLKLPLPAPPSADGAASLQPSSSALPHISPFQSSSCFGWRNEVVGGASATAAGNSSVHAQ